MKTLVIVGALALSVGGAAAPALAEPARATTVASTVPSSDSTATPQQADTRRYCVVGSVTGSRLERKECKTRADWLKEGFDPLATK